MAVLGSVHAFSVFLAPIQSLTGAGRAEASLTYSLALMCLTAAVLFGHHVFRRLSPPVLIGAVGGLGILGLVVAAHGSDIATIWIGYGVLFGAANGLGYAFALQFTAQALPRFKGLAMGWATAWYGLSAAVAPVPLVHLIDVAGVAAGMFGLAGALAVAAPLTAVAYALSGRTLAVDLPVDGGPAMVPGRMVGMLALGYGTAVSAGLMAIGHATEIGRWADLAPGLIVAAPVVIGVLNTIGSVSGGWLADRWTARAVLIGAAALSGVALAALAGAGDAVWVLAALGVVGLAYGATIAVYPVMVSDLAGPVAGVRVYGRVFIAWGTAGLLAPVAAGLLFDGTGGYGIVLAGAAAIAVVAMLIAWFLPTGQAGQTPSR